MMRKFVLLSMAFAFVVISSEGRSASNKANIQAEKNLLRDRKIDKLEKKHKNGGIVKTAYRKSGDTLNGFSIQEARDFVDLIGAKIIQLLQNKGISRDEQERRYRRILDDHFDMRAIAAYTLGRYRRQYGGAEVEEFTELFTQLTVENYVDQFKKYKNQSLQLKNREYKKGPYLVVSSEIVQGGGAKNIDVQWLIKKRGNGSLAVYELEVEGVGLRKTKRRIYGVTLRKKGLKGLISDMKKELQRYNGLARQR